jgi:NhaP-type Na+/H+ or K+/H+ antiporter
MSPVLAAAIGSVVVLALEAASAMLANRTGLPHKWLGLVSLLVYGAAGWLAVEGTDGDWLVGAAVGAAVAAVDATVGLRVARAIGVEEDVPESLEPAVATIVTLLGAVVGAVGAAMA